MADVTLVNLNVVQVPAIGPYAIDILGSALEEHQHRVAVLDLSRGDDPAKAIDDHFAVEKPDLVGLTMRNNFDLYFPSFANHDRQGSFVHDHAAIIRQLKGKVSADRLVIGGVGFSTAPMEFLRYFALHYGVRGPGERIIVAMADACDAGGDLRELPFPSLQRGAHVVYDGRKLEIQRRVQRKFVDNRWYYEYGGLGNLRTSNGCGMRCAYCAEPFAKGARFARSRVDDVMAELDQLVEMGIYDVLTADSEFNMPFSYSKAILRGIIERRYPKQLRLWAYCQPSPFDEEYAALLAEAGVPGVNLGTDHTDPEMLRRLHKWYGQKEIVEVTRLCRKYGLAVMHELLFGYPGDTPEKMYRAIDFLLDCDPTVIGVTIGLGVLQGTALGERFTEERKLQSRPPGFYFKDTPFIFPVYYVDPSFKIPEIYGDLARYVGERIDRIMIPRTPGSGDTDNQLVNSERLKKQLQKEGKKGAYWYHYRKRDGGEGVAGERPAAVNGSVVAAGERQGERP
jgi:tryptophan 2-C-methyltransferase